MEGERPLGGTQPLAEDLVHHLCALSGAPASTTRAHTPSGWSFSTGGSACAAAALPTW
jgi:hypothetical protein